MIHAGLVSITFRNLSPREIVDLVAQAGLESIEWGGDVPVPHGDVARAREVRQITEGAGIQMPSYGSYYRVGVDEPPFEAVLESAVALGAPVVRVWAGKLGSDAADAAHRDLIVSESRRIADLAAGANALIAYEYHRNTLTDTNESAQWLLDAVDRDNVGTYWQPPYWSDVAYGLEGLAGILPLLYNLHVFTWNWNPETQSTERRPLAEGEAQWSRYLALAATSEREHHAMIEFVMDGTPESLLADAATLNRWLDRVNG